MNNKSMKIQNEKVMLISAAVIWGTIGLFIRNVSLSPGEMALYRAILAAILLAGYLAVTKQRMAYKEIKKELLLLVISGIALALNWIFLLAAYNYTTVAVVTLCDYFAPVIATIVSLFLFRERMTIKQFICLLMSTIGLVLIIDISGVSRGETDIRGILFGLSASVLFALMIVLNRCIKKVGGIHRTFLQFIVATICLIPCVMVNGGMHLERLDTKGWVSMLIIGFLHTGVGYCLYFSALKNISGQKVAVLSYFDPLVAVLVSVFLLKESMSVGQMIGGAMILGFTLWNESLDSH